MSQVKKGGSKKPKGRKNDAEWRLLHEQETRRRREELMEVFMKDKIVRESAGNRLNVLKLNWKWRSVLRDVKTEELQIETQTLEETFDHLVGTKNNIICSLAKEIDECKIHQAESVESHSHNLEKLIDIQDAHLKKLNQVYDVQKNQITRMLTSEQNDSLARHQAFAKRLETMEEDLNAQHVQFQSGIFMEYQSLKDELLNKSLEEQHSLRIQLGIAVEGLWHQIQQVLKTYHQNIEDKKKMYYELKAKDEKTAAEIADQTARQVKLEEGVSKMKAFLESANIRQQEAHEKQIKEREELILELQSVRGKMENLREENNERMGKLTLNSRKTLNCLERKITKGRNLLKLEEICMKYEAAPASQLSVEDSPDSEKNVMIPIGDVMPYNNGKVDTVSNLENMWKRYNYLNLKKCIAHDEVQRLGKENLMLQNVLKKYFNDLSQNVFSD